jgi:polysaccharide biosynthesis transport protein
MDDIVFQGLRQSRVQPIARRGRSRIRLVAQVSVVALLIASISAATYPFLPRKYSATAEVLLHPTNQEGGTSWDQSIRDAFDDSAIQTKIDILRSEALQANVVDEHNLTADPEFNPALKPSWLRRTVDGLPWLAPWIPPQRSDIVHVRANLTKHLIVKRGKSYFMTVGYESADPTKAELLANTLAKRFYVDQVKRKAKSQNDLLAAMKERIDKGEAAYHTNEQIEQDFIVSSGLIHRADKESMDRQLASLSTSYAEAQRRSLEATSRAEMLTSQRAGDIDSTLDALSSPLLQHLRQRMVEVSSGVGSGNSTGPSGASQTVLGFLHQGIEAETQHLVKAAQNEATVAQQNEAALHADLARLDARLMVWQANERHRIDLHRAVTDSLDDLHEERRRFEAQSGRGEVLQSDVEIVSFAEVPDRPSFPDPLLYMAGTFAVIGLFSGLIFLPSMRVVRAH